MVVSACVSLALLCLQQELLDDTEKPSMSGRHRWLPSGSGRTAPGGGAVCGGTARAADTRRQALRTPARGSALLLLYCCSLVDGSGSAHCHLRREGE